MSKKPANSLQVQLISGPDSWDFDEVIEAGLSAAGFDVARVDVDAHLASNDLGAIADLLNPAADASVVVSALRWNRLASLLDESLLPNGITLTTNRAASLEEKHQPRFALARPIGIEGIQPVIRAIELLTSPVGGSWQQFEKDARDFMGLHTGVEFQPGRVNRVPKLFDMVWKNGKIVGDAKYLTLVKGTRLPPAKFMEIAGHVWLLNATKANRAFLIFGNDKRVAERWLEKYGALVQRVEFYFLGDYGEFERLK